MAKVTILLSLFAAAGLILLLMGCPGRKPAEQAQVDVSGDAVTFPAYTIKKDELEAPQKGPYTAFSGNYPEHWPSAWQLNDSFFLANGGAITERLTELDGQPVAVWEFEGAFQGSVDELTLWFSEKSSALGVAVTSNELDPIFEVIQRRSVSFDREAWDGQGLMGSMQISYGLRYDEFSQFVFSAAKRLEEEPVPAEPVTE